MKQTARWLPGLCSLLILTSAVAQQISPPPRDLPLGLADADATPADRIVSRAALELSQRKSVDAKLRQRIDLFDRSLIGSGSYVQQGRGGDLRWRLELKMLQSDGKLNSLVHVCDGQNLWIYQDELERPTLGRIDMRKVRSALDKRNPWGTATLSMMSLGGLPKLLESADRAFRFVDVRETQLDNVSVIQARGVWDRPMLAALLPDEKSQIEAGQRASLARLPKHLPWAIELMLGRDDLFPYRVAYLRPAPTDEKRLSKAPAEEVLAAARPIVVLECFEVKLDAPIEGQPFLYQPGNLEIVDQTEKTIKSLSGQRPN